MFVYCTSHNTDLTYLDYVAIDYIGTSVDDAEKAVGEFSTYAITEENFPIFNAVEYSALPKEINWEMIQFFLRGAFWYSIVRFELEDPTAKESHALSTS